MTNNSPFVLEAVNIGRDYQQADTHLPVLDGVILILVKRVRRWPLLVCQAPVKPPCSICLAASMIQAAGID